MKGNAASMDSHKTGQRIIFLLLLAVSIIAWIILAVQNTSVGMTMDMSVSKEEMQALMGSAVGALAIVKIPSLGMFLPMWAIMSIAMMLPTAIPMILSVEKICKKNGESKIGNIYANVLLFTLAYCLVWTFVGIIGWGIFYVLSKLFKVWLDSWKNVWLIAGALFLFCGIYQVSPLKNACLTGCQHPFLFLTKNYRPGKRGAFHMGIKHGMECSGCCWGLMLAMLPLGIMNIVWMGVFTVLMTVEKNAKYGTLIGKLVGYVLIFAGVVVLIMACAFYRL